MPVIPSDTVRIDERPDAADPTVAARIAQATDGVDHATDPTRRAGAGFEQAAPKRRGGTPTQLPAPAPEAPPEAVT